MVLNNCIHATRIVHVQPALFASGRRHRFPVANFNKFCSHQHFTAKKSIHFGLKLKDGDYQYTFKLS